MALAQNLSFILLGEDRTASKTMDAAAAKAEVVTGRIGSAFSKAGGIVGGEFGNILGEVGSKIDDTGGRVAKLSTGLIVGGGVATVTGLALLKMGSGYKQASDQLDQASKTAGDSVQGFSGKIEEAVQKAQNFDHSAVDTKDALAKLTEASGSTQKALDNMSVVTDLAAARHISLSDAATLVNRILGGSGAKTLAQYNIHMEKAVDPTKALAAAQKLVTAESDRLSIAQTKLAQLQEVDHAKKKLTVADHIALQNAQAAVTKASGNLDAAQKKLNDTSDKTITKEQAGKDALDQLAKKLNGQGAASVNNFGSQVDIMRTKIQDWVEQVSGPVGSVLAGMGPLFTIAGVAVDLYRAKKEAATLAEIASAAAATEATVATEAETTAQTALDASMDANPIGLVALAIGAVAAVAGGIALGATQGLTQSTKDYASALENVNGDLEKNIENIARKALLDDGALAAARKLGIDGATAVQAALGNAAAQRQVNDALTAQKKALDEQLASAQPTAEAGRAIQYSQKDARSEIDLLNASINNQTGQLKEARTQADLLSNSFVTLAQRQADASGSRYAGQAAAYANQPKRAAGGDIMHNETALVGENGPEVVALPGGSHVYPTGQGPSSGGGGLNVTVMAPAGFFVGTAADVGKALASNLIGGLRNGQVSKTELRAALGL